MKDYAAEINHSVSKDYAAEINHAVSKLYSQLQEASAVLIILYLFFPQHVIDYLHTK